MLACIHGENTQRGRREEKVYEHDDGRESGEHRALVTTIRR